MNPDISRIGTRALAYAPEVVTPELARVVVKYKPVIMKFSFTHPDEITELCEEKLGILADEGIVLFQQGPLLKNINDSTEILKKDVRETGQKQGDSLLRRVWEFYARNTAFRRIPGGGGKTRLGIGEQNVGILHPHPDDAGRKT